MLGKLARTVFGSANDRFVKRQFKIVQQINTLEPEIEKLNNDELKGKTDEFRRRLKEGETLDDILPEAFAVVREAAQGYDCRNEDRRGKNAGRDTGRLSECD